MPYPQTDQSSNVPPGSYLVFNQTIFPLTQIVTHIGRKPENDLVIQDISVSRFHAQIRVENDKFVIHDLNSHNGTLVNQTRVKHHVLKPGTLVYLGNVMVVFVQEDKRITESLERDTGELTHT